jgi:hypothetical protein
VLPESGPDEASRQVYVLLINGNSDVFVQPDGQPAVVDVPAMTVRIEEGGSRASDRFSIARSPPRDCFSSSVCSTAISAECLYLGEARIAVDKFLRLVARIERGVASGPHHTLDGPADQCPPPPPYVLLSPSNISNYFRQCVDLGGNSCRSSSHT